MTHKHKKTVLIVFSIVFSALMVALVCLFSYQKAYAGKIYKNVYFGEIDLSGKTKKQAEYILKNKFDTLLGREITFTANSKTAKSTIKDTGLSFDYQRIANESYKIGRNGSFFANLRSSTKTFYKKIPVSLSPTIDDATYKKFLDVVVAQLMSQTQDATLTVSNGKIVLTDSKDGQTIETEDLAEKIISLANSGLSTIELKANISPAKTTAASVDAAKTQAEKYLSSQIVFAYQDKKYSPTPTQIGNWIDFKVENGQYVTSINSANLKAYLNLIAKNFEVASLDRKINANTGEIIDAGRDAIVLNKDKAVQDYLAQSANNNVSVTLLTTTTPAKELRILPEEGLVLGRFEGKYIDVDLPKQKLCRIEGQTLIDCFTVSTGKPSMPTPTGTYAVQSKDPRKWSGTYGLWMPWWQQWNGPYGIHELPEWPNGYKEGAAHLGIPVSHGCIRLGVGPAETVYNWTVIGTPVYIHK